MLYKQDYGCYVFSKPIAPVFIANGLLTLPHFTPLLPSLGSRAEAVRLVTSGCFMTAVFASCAYRLDKAVLGDLICARKRHNHMLIAGAAALSGMEVYAFTCQPVPAANVNKQHLASMELGSALAVALLWANRPRQKQAVQANTSWRFTY